MNSDSVIFPHRPIIEPYEQDMMSVQTKYLGEWLCGQHQQLLKCVLALKWQCTWWIN